ncbi:MAG: hypothetical protein PHD73_07435 [Sediminibacterium sp.]|nr:hypothetical protein [Sediminibacterium sp.]
MLQSLFLRCSLVLFFSLALYSGNAQEKKMLDTVKAGIYITSIHDIDFKQNEFAINLWLWLKYKNRDFNFDQNLEIPQAKSFSKLYTTIDSTGGEFYVLMKLQCLMKDSWKISSFPFDKQMLRLSFENSQFDSESLVFVPDTLGKHFDPRFTLRGWNIDSFSIVNGIKLYETGFGDASLDTPHTEYSSLKVRVGITREAGGIFWKMFMGMYVAFLISFICFFIHADSIDSRFGLSVGALFAAIGNKYIIDSALPESVTYTLVDTLHGLTLFFIFAMVSFSVYSLSLIKKNQIAKADRMDKIGAVVCMAAYILLNFYFIQKAIG